MLKKLVKSTSLKKNDIEQRIFMIIYNIQYLKVEKSEKIELNIGTWSI